MESILAGKGLFGKTDEERKYFLIFLVCLIIMSFLSIHFLKPKIGSDTATYLQTMSFLQGGAVSADFAPNRILTTFFSLQAVIFSSKIFGDIMTGWIVLNLFFYFLLNIVFYKILFKIFQSSKTALLGGLFLAANYAMLSFGLNYLMDISGWTFYIISLYFTLCYVQNGKNRNIFWALFSAGVGGLFKEYAFLGCIPIILFLLYENRSVWQTVKKSILPAVISFLPLVLVYLYMWSHFHYTYLDWLSSNQIMYVYRSRIVEYIKSFGSLWNFLGILIPFGLYYFWKSGNEIISDDRQRFFIFC